MTDILNGCFLSTKYIFKKKVTINYPFEKGKISCRFRGEHALRKYEDGTERCIGCKLCETICPANAIFVESGFDKEKNVRFAKKYVIDLTKCIFCGLCEEACPVNAIVQTPNFEYAKENRFDFVYNKEKLLENGTKWEILLEENIKKKLKK